MGDVCVLRNETQHSDLWGITVLLSHMQMMQRCSPSVLQSPSPNHHAKELLGMTGGQKIHWSELGLKRLVVSSLQCVTLKTFVTQLFPAELLTRMAGVVTIE